MSRRWQRSGLTVGEELRVPSTLFVEGLRSADRLEWVRYIGETSTGIMIDCKFTPAAGTQEPENSHYKMHIAWASIWCGQVKVYREDDTQVIAKRMPGAPIAYEVMKA